MSSSLMENIKMLCLYISLLTFLTMSSTLHIITPNHPLRDNNNNNQTLISANGTFEAGKNWSLTSWKAYRDPTPGAFSFHIDTNGLPQLVITNEGRIISRPGSWNGVRIVGVVEEENESSFVMNKEEISYEIKPKNLSTLLRSRLIPLGFQVLLRWSNETGWVYDVDGAADKCEKYAFCGVNAICEAKGCGCLIGFKEDSTRNSSGCVRIRNTTQECSSNKGNEDTFHLYQGIKLPDTSSSWYDNTISLKECEQLCLKNCSCTAYSKLNVSGAVSGCLQWFSDIVDMRKLSVGGQDFYLRVTTASKPDGRSKKKKLIKILVGCGVGVFIICSILIGLLLFYIKKKWFMQPESIDRKDDDGIDLPTFDRKDDDDIDLPTLDILAISNATNHFSDSNRLGEGGFGPVFKGILEDGQEIAVKRLSSKSKQGVEEFKNEVMLIAKLQHRNLVKLIGCSIHQGERLLIYEFMPNGSLDHLLFDSTKRKSLGWAVRFKIIDGTARGLMYLHQDSRLKVIHRDLKAGNILLDGNMNPKISDFGTARTFDQDQEEAKTNKMMGTFGYMSPEYVGEGSISVKSDVYSFGVLVIEIISGRQNRGFVDPHLLLNLPGHAWKLWTENRPAEFIDDILENDSTSLTEILRYLHIGLLCVQKRPEDRPEMSTVVLMLNGEKILPGPSQPGFYIAEDPPIQGDFGGSGSSFSLSDTYSSLQGN